MHQNLEEEKEDSSCPLNPGNFKKCKLLPDGACLFTRAMGKVIDSTKCGERERESQYMYARERESQYMYAKMRAASSGESRYDVMYVDMYEHI